MQVHYRPQGIFHTVIQGQCYLREGGSDDLVLLRAGDGVAFPTGGAHWICDSPRRQDPVADNVVKVTGDDGLLLLKTGEVTVSASDSAHWGNDPRMAP